MKTLTRLSIINLFHPFQTFILGQKIFPIKIALKYNIPLIFYGEDGEIEYGGSTESKNKALYDISYMKKVYLEGGHQKVLDRIKQDPDISESDLSFFMFPTDNEVKEKFTKSTDPKDIFNELFGEKK